MINVACRSVVVNGNAQPVEPQVFDLIMYLIENRDRTLSRKELFETIWQGRTVTYASLSSRIKTARKLMLDNGRDQCVIRTYHGYGYRFVAPIVISDEPLQGVGLTSSGYLERAQLAFAEEASRTFGFPAQYASGSSGRGRHAV